MKEFDLPDSGGAYEENPDVCSIFASLFNQRQSIERLLSWLRESQTACTDTNCFDDINGLPGTEQGAILGSSSPEYSSETDAFALVLWFVVGLLTLYAMNLSRDRDLRNRSSTKGGNLDGPTSSRDDHRRPGEDDDHSSPAV